MMASQMVVPASKDTLFMRGFSARQHVDDIRDFFADSGGHCTVEFFKEADQDEKLYIALRFETKDIAKDILNRYNNNTVLGDKITISWFKDLRRARARAWRGGHNSWGPGPAAARRRWSPQRGEYRSNWNYSPPRHNRDGWRDRNHGSRGRSPIGTRVRKFDHSSSRSPSHSRSRSHSRSYSRSRSRSSSHSPRRVSHHRRSRSFSETREAPVTRRTRSSSRSPHDLRGKNDGSHRKSLDPADDEEDDWHMGKSHSPVRPVNRDKYPDRLPEPANRSRAEDPISEHRSYDGSPPRVNKQLRSTVVSVDLPQRKDGPADDSEGTKNYTDNYDNYKDKNIRAKDDHYFDADDRNSGNQKFSPEKASPGHRTHYSTSYDYYDHRNREDKRSYTPDEGHGREDERASREIADPDSPLPYAHETAVDKHKDDREEGEVASRSSRMSRDLVDRHSLERDHSPDGDRRKRGHDPEGRPAAYTSRHDSDILDNKRRKYEEAAVLKEHRDGYDDRVGKSRYNEDDVVIREQSPVADDRTKASLSVNGGLTRELEKGIPLLTQDKMATVREKKDEIERAYRQDCETFAAVVKMLVSKDSSLETKLQFSLRENLKEIGQRCIYELREFIDRVKTEEETHR